jgi:cold-inducible RNA-binding protein
MPRRRLRSGNGNLAHSLPKRSPTRASRADVICPRVVVGVEAAAHSKGHTVGNRLFVGNLSFGTTQQVIEQAFAAAGEVREVALPTDRESGRPRGFAFVTMADERSAQNAISQLNGAELDGRQIRVDIAQERQGGGGFGGGGGGYGGGSHGGGGRKSGGGSRRGSRDRF